MLGVSYEVGIVEQGRAMCKEGDWTEGIANFNTKGAMEQLLNGKAVKLQWIGIWRLDAQCHHAFKLHVK